MRSIFNLFCVASLAVSVTNCGVSKSNKAQANSFKKDSKAELASLCQNLKNYQKLLGKVSGNNLRTGPNANGMYDVLQIEDFQIETLKYPTIDCTQSDRVDVKTMLDGGKYKTVSYFPSEVSGSATIPSINGKIYFLGDGELNFRVDLAIFDAVIAVNEPIPANRFEFVLKAFEKTLFCDSTVEGLIAAGAQFVTKSSTNSYKVEKFEKLANDSYGYTSIARPSESVFTFDVGGNIECRSTQLKTVITNMIKDPVLY